MCVCGLCVRVCVCVCSCAARTRARTRRATAPQDAPNFNEIVESIRDGIMRKVEAVAAQLTAPTPSGGSIVSPGRTPGSFEITVKLGSEFVRIEVDAGISPAEVAASFCERCVRGACAACVFGCACVRVCVCVCVFVCAAARRRPTD